ncbi:hypothetical protein J5N58_01150 [Rhizobium cremeum]|uniref:hypothetical protein n=1 Tax=Rhizobium cremeum TaxID=2813827 RepID=UPI001FD53687|nr:hypothetical protein [Rhizobium cremeum]MCJ7993203.1 hypothetical protein [Rhizobium cremeum]MCJ7998268.1 hypothetical protein [Rhizobium cremeum]
MAIRKFTADGVWNTGIPGRSESGYRCLKYAGSLGGGTLSVHSLTDEVDSETAATIETPLADAELSATTLDDNGDAVQQMTFQTTGTIVVKLAGATAPSVKVIVE